MQQKVQGDRFVREEGWKRVSCAHDRENEGCGARGWLLIEAESAHSLDALHLPAGEAAQCRVAAWCGDNQGGGSPYHVLMKSWGEASERWQVGNRDAAFRVGIWFTIRAYIPRLCLESLVEVCSTDTPRLCRCGALYTLLMPMKRWSRNV